MYISNGYKKRAHNSESTCMTGTLLNVLFTTLELLTILLTTLVYYNMNMQSLYDK